MSARALAGESLGGTMTQAEINKAIRSLAYLKTPDRVRAGVRNTYGVSVPIERVQRILREVQSVGSFKAKIGEPTEADAWDFDVRVHPSARVYAAQEIAANARPALRPRAPLPKQVPSETPNPFEGPFQFKRLAVSVSRDMGLDPVEVIGANRARKFILARLVLTKLCLEHGMSCVGIGIKMGGRDHSTILNQRDKFEPYAAIYPQVRACYERHVAMREKAREARKVAA